MCTKVFGQWPCRLDILTVVKNRQHHFLLVTRPTTKTRTCDQYLPCVDAFAGYRGGAKRLGWCKLGARRPRPGKTRIPAVPCMPKKMWVCTAGTGSLKCFASGSPVRWRNARVWQIVRKQMTRASNLVANRTKLRLDETCLHQNYQSQDDLVSDRRIVDVVVDDVYRGKKLSSQFLTPIDFQVFPK